MQNHLWAAAMLTIGGTFTLIKSLDTSLNKILFIIGWLAFFALLNFYLNKITVIKMLIKKMEDSKNA